VTAFLLSLLTPSIIPFRIEPPTPAKSGSHAAACEEFLDSYQARLQSCRKRMSVHSASASEG